MEARRHKLVVKSFERKPLGAYREKLAPAPPPAPPPEFTRVRPPKPAAIKPPSPGVDRKPTPLETQLKRKHARLDALKWLRATFPGLFYGDPKPIAIGAGRELVARALESGHWPSRGKARDSVGAAICYYTGSIAYLTALAEPGAMRHGLDGEPVGAVDAEHQAEALKLISARKKERQPRNAETSS
jgi:hypothetical protein